MLRIYPIGSIYMSTVATSPAELFGGQWTRIEGRFLLAADSSHAPGSTGGAESVTSGGTAITVEQMPSHNHLIAYLPSKGDPSGFDFPEYVVGTNDIIPAGGGKYSPTGGSQTGGNQPHCHTVATMPPYLAVYVWQRVA